jgi:L-alanine-DL-glutamate epimerase-like enolase superfamily enzyme
MHVEISRVDWELVATFRISYRARTHAQTVVVELRDGDWVGRGEALGVSYHGESADSLSSQLQAVADKLQQGISREEAATLLPPGGARNAVDCALWDLEAKRAGQRAWNLAGLGEVRPIMTDYTLGVDTPEAMAKTARELRQYSIFKLKLTGEGDLERVGAVHAARPDATLIVDPNQAWSERQLHEFTPRLAELGVKLIEQPLPVGQDEALAAFDSPVPLCADESCQTVESLQALVGKYQYVNIKLDKTGGLTEALRLARAAREMDFRLMVGCMGGSSLSMAPAFIIGQWCDFCDLDGPLWSKHDVPNGIRYEGNQMFAPGADLWG